MTRSAGPLPPNPGLPGPPGEEAQGVLDINKLTSNQQREGNRSHGASRGWFPPNPGPLVEGQLSLLEERVLPRDVVGTRSLAQAPFSGTSSSLRAVSRGLILMRKPSEAPREGSSVTEDAGKTKSNISTDKR